MKKRRGRTCRSSAAELLDTPPTTVTPSPANESPSSVIFNRNDSSNRKISPSVISNVGKNRVAASLFQSPTRSTLNTISDLKNLASSHLLDLKRHIDHSHSQILKDIDSSHARLHKRFKLHSQACQQTMDEAEKEYKKMSQRICDSRAAMKASYEEFLAHEQESASRAFKTSMTGLSESFERSINALRGRYGITST